MAMGHTLINIFCLWPLIWIVFIFQQYFIQIVLTISLFIFGKRICHKLLYGQSPVISILPILNFHK